MTARLFGRSTSHFTRVVTIFAHEVGFEYELVPIRKLRGMDPDAYGSHPGLKMPTMHFDSDVTYGAVNICREIARRTGKVDAVEWPYSRIDDAASANFDEIVFQAMSTQVAAVMAKEVARVDAENILLTKSLAGLTGMMQWLNANFAAYRRSQTAEKLSITEIALFCLLEHIKFRRSIGTEALFALNDFAKSFASRASAASTDYVMWLPINQDCWYLKEA